MTHTETKIEEKIEMKVKAKTEAKTETGKEAKEFRDALAQHIPESSNFYSNINRIYDILSEVRGKTDGHGITFVIRRDEEPSRLDKHLRNAKPYNGRNHSIYERDIAGTVASKRERDLATIVNSDGRIVGAGVYLPADDVAYQQRHGIDCNISEFMDFTPDEDGPGGRTISALCSSELIGDSVAILTLGENHPGENKGQINLYYCGDRLYNSAGREMLWEAAETLPPTRKEKRSRMGQPDEEDAPAPYSHTPAYAGAPAGA